MGGEDGIEVQRRRSARLVDRARRSALAVAHTGRVPVVPDSADLVRVRGAVHRLRQAAAEASMKALTLAAWTALLGLVLLPPCLLFAGWLDTETVQMAMLVGTLAWFGLAGLRATRA